MKYVFLFFIILLGLLVGCSTPIESPVKISNTSNETIVNISTKPMDVVVTVPKTPAVPTGQYVLELLSTKEITYDGDKYALTITSANSDDNMAVLEVEKDQSRLTRNLVEDRFITVNDLYFCVLSLKITEKPATVTAVILPLTKPMIEVSRYVDSPSCESFSELKGTTTPELLSFYFSEQYTDLNDEKFISLVLDSLTKTEPTDATMVAWQYYLKDGNTRADMVTLITSTDEFKDLFG
ncbi:MAG TPA: DUF4214 domain-containing protein [Acidobacteriota bacterium]|nr:DUF4214 domain-containing protein [Acidobacteriota bacterium]